MMFWFGAATFAVATAWLLVIFPSTKKEDQVMKNVLTIITILVIILYLVYIWQVAQYVPYQMNPTVTPLR